MGIISKDASQRLENMQAAVRASYMLVSEVIDEESGPGGSIALEFIPSKTMVELKQARTKLKSIVKSLSQQQYSDK